MLDWWMLSRAQDAVLTDMSSFGYSATARLGETECARFMLMAIKVAVQHNDAHHHQEELGEGKERAMLGIGAVLTHHNCSAIGRYGKDMFAATRRADR